MTGTGSVAAKANHPTRWLSAPKGGKAPVNRLAALIRASELALGISARARARIWWRLCRG